MTLCWLSESFAVSSYDVVFSDFQSVTNAGILHVINNRPYEEDWRSVNIGMMAASHGITYSYLPFTFNSVSAETVFRFSDTVEVEAKPILAFCKTGLRSAALWATFEILQGRETMDSALAAAAEVNLIEARPMIEKLLAEVQQKEKAS